jgi:hypothetical protein
MADWVEFAQHLIKKIDAAVDATKDRMVDGGCSNFEEYKYSTGWIHGLMFTRETVKSLLKNIEGIDDD